MPNPDLSPKMPMMDKVEDRLEAEQLWALHIYDYKSDFQDPIKHLVESGINTDDIEIKPLELRGEQPAGFIPRAIYLKSGEQRLTYNFWDGAPNLSQLKTAWTKGAEDIIQNYLEKKKKTE